MTGGYAAVMVSPSRTRCPVMIFLGLNLVLTEGRRMKDCIEGKAKVEK
jgi:hypothetical protein